MKEYLRFYKIAGIVFKIVSPFSFEGEKDQNSHFLTEAQDADFTLSFRYITDIAPFLENVMKQVHTSDWLDIYIDEKETEYGFFKMDGIYIAVTVCEKNAKEATTYYLDENLMKQRMRQGSTPLSYIRIEKGLMQNQALLLHSCHVQYKNRSILFSAPSGTGKSTQGELWREYLHADVINGDRTVLRKIEGQWMACGVPMKGTSGISQNKDEKLGAIIVIRQGKEDIVGRVRLLDAFRYIYSEIILNTWDASYVEKAIELISEMTAEVPVYYFECTKMKSAVETLVQQLEKDGIF